MFDMEIFCLLMETFGFKFVDHNQHMVAIYESPNFPGVRLFRDHTDEVVVKRFREVPMYTPRGWENSRREDRWEFRHLSWLEGFLKIL